MGTAITRKSKVVWPDSEGLRSVRPLPTWLDPPSAVRKLSSQDVCRWKFMGMFGVPGAVCALFFCGFLFVFVFLIKMVTKISVDASGIG